jgi:hypothetical protein
MRTEGNAPEALQKPLDLGTRRQPSARSWSRHGTHDELPNHSVCASKSRSALVQAALVCASTRQCRCRATQLELGLKLLQTPATDVVELERIASRRISH